MGLLEALGSVAQAVQQLVADGNYDEDDVFSDEELSQIGSLPQAQTRAIVAEVSAVEDDE